MRYALISDIHANLPALRAVLMDIAARPGIDATYHLGDLVGYAPWPNETVALLRERGIEGIAGNYDSTTATDYKHCGCTYEDPHQAELAHLSYEWTLQHCSPETKRFLGQLPEVGIGAHQGADPGIFELLGAPDLRERLAVRADPVGMATDRRVYVEQRSVGVEDIGGMMHASLLCIRGFTQFKAASRAGRAFDWPSDSRARPVDARRAKVFCIDIDLDRRSLR